MDPGELLTFGQAAARIGVHRRTMFNRVQRVGVPVFEDALDRRRRLIRAADIPRLAAPRLVERREAVAGETRQ